jgi:CDP-diacylglycerol--glycerol-3-phosphate 3-phosphatidyltransferase
MRINIPNQITLGRLVLAAVFFVLLSLFNAAEAAKLRWLLIASFWIFLVAAFSDVLDGLLARWLKQETAFGRVIDPIVDKVMICGAFVFFASPKFFANGQYITDVKPWMAVVILARELAVSGIRAHAEAGGEKFAALWAGKLKMFVQSVTVAFILVQLGWELETYAPVRTALVWVTVVITVLSIISYLRRAHSFLLSSAALGGTPPPSKPAELPPRSGPPTSANNSPGAAV